MITLHITSLVNCLECCILPWPITHHPRIFCRYVPLYKSQLSHLIKTEGRALSEKVPLIVCVTMLRRIELPRCCRYSPDALYNEYYTEGLLFAREVIGQLVLFSNLFAT